MIMDTAIDPRVLPSVIIKAIAPTAEKTTVGSRTEKRLGVNEEYN
jgi:hypothetical protein